MPKYTIDTLKHIISFLDWTCDLEPFVWVSKILKLTSIEKQQILAYWKSRSRFNTYISDVCCVKSVNNKIHCDDGPAIKYANGDTQWYTNGYMHRLDGPARITKFFEEWRYKDRIHRSNGLPAVICANGDQEWWENSQLHRLGGPAKITKLRKCWCVQGKLHREDGPAVEYADGQKEYWINGVHISRFTFWFRNITGQIGN